MIVRIQGEGQFELDDSARGELERLDENLFNCIESTDETGFPKALADVVQFIESKGSPVANDVLVASDIIMPASDVSLDEAKSLFTDEGLLHPVEA